MIVTTPQGEELTYDVPVAVASKYDVILTPQNPTPRVGQKVDFDLQLPKNFERALLGPEAYVLAIHDEVAVASTRVALHGGDHATGSIVLGPEARGLTHLVVLDGRADAVGQAPLWVRSQQAMRVLDLALPQKPVHPGEHVTAKLAFPPPQRSALNKQSASGQPPVTFGLWAVDEALYALRERTDLPLGLLLDAPADIVATVADALSRPDHSPQATAARLMRSIPAPALRTGTRTTWIDKPYETDHKQPWMILWSILATLTIAGMLIREFGRVADLVTWKVVLWPIVPLAIGAPVLAFGVVASTMNAAPLAGMAVCAALLLYCGVAVPMDVLGSDDLDDLCMWRWFASSLAGFVALCAVNVALSKIGLDKSDLITVDIPVGIFVTLIVVQLLMYASILWERGHRSTAVELLVVMLIPFATAPVVFGRTAKQKFLYANSAVENQITFGDDDAGSPPTGSTTKADKATPSKHDSAKPVRVRDYFPDTMIWRPEIASDAQGHARVDLRVPDSLTTWRVQAVASTPDGRLGEASAPLRVRQPFYVDVDLPQQLTRGDTLELPVALVDARKVPKGSTRVDLSVEADGSLAVLDAPSHAEVPAGKRAVVWVRLRANHLGEGSLTVRARLVGNAGAATSSHGDAVRHTTRVVADGRRISISHSDIVDEGFHAQLVVPRDAIAQTASARVDLLAGPTAAALDGVDAMLREPHGCFEQTTSITYPNVLILRALQSIKPAQWPDGPRAYAKVRARAKKLVSEGLQRILTFQTPDGGFALYPDDQPRVDLTAYGVLQLSEIQKVLHLDLGPTISHAADWLQIHQDSDGGWSAEWYANAPISKDAGRARLTAFALWALSRAHRSSDIKKATSSAIARLTDLLAQPDVGDFEHAFAANALLAAHRPRAAQKLVDALAASVQPDGDRDFWNVPTVSWMGAGGVYANIATTALAARVMARSHSHPDLLKGALAYLAHTRQPRGGWGTTEATVWALDAMSSAFEASSTKPVRLAVRADDHLLGKVRVIPQRSAPQTLRTKLQRGAHRVDITPGHPTGAIAQTTASYTVPWNSPHARVRAPFDVRLHLHKRSLEVGKRAAVEVTVRNTTAQRSGAIILELPIPPGGWAGTIKYPSKLVHIDRLDQTPTHLVVYLSHLDAKVSANLSYDIVPRVRGSYRLPPLVAYPYYAPRPKAEVSGGSLVVGRGR